MFIAEAVTGSWADVVSRLVSDEDTLALVIPILAITMFGTIGIMKLLLRHRERMALIEQGIHPEYPPEESIPPDP